jgi:hypothetical protein
VTQFIVPHPLDSDDRELGVSGLVHQTAEEKTVIAGIRGRFRPVCSVYRCDGSERVMPR